MISINECPICNGSKIKPVFQCKDYTVTNKLFEIKECTDCTFRFTSPRPTDRDLGQYYLSNDYISHSNEAKKLTDKIYLLARNYTLGWKRKLIDSLNFEQPTKRLLDYGCGTGSFLNHMIQHGWTATGLEPSEQARQIAERLTGQKLISSLAELENQEFDIITLWHVLEHVPLLHQTIDQLKGILATNGRLIVAVPNYKAHEEETFKNHWAGYDVPRHLWHFNQVTMAKLMTQHGLRIARTVPLKLDAYYISLLSEKYFNNNQQSLIHLPKAFFKGLQSNLSARRTNEYSSLIYVITK